MEMSWASLEVSAAKSCCWPPSSFMDPFSPSESEPASGLGGFFNCSKISSSAVCTRAAAACGGAVDARTPGLMDWMISPSHFWEKMTFLSRSSFRTFSMAGTAPAKPGRAVSPRASSRARLCFAASSSSRFFCFSKYLSLRLVSWGRVLRKISSCLDASSSIWLPEFSPLLAKLLSLPSAVSCAACARVLLASCACFKSSWAILRADARSPRSNASLKDERELTILSKFISLTAGRFTKSSGSSLGRS